MDRLTFVGAVIAALGFEPGADVARDYVALAARLEQSLGAVDRA